MFLVAPKLLSIPDKIFSIIEFGAIANDHTDNTNAIQKSITAASTVGEGRVVVPAEILICGPLQFSSYLDLQLNSGALLKF